MTVEALALMLDDKAVVTAVVDDTALPAHRAWPGVAFADLCEPGAAEVARRFATAVRARGGAAEWELEFGRGAARVRLTLYGARVPSGLIVVGTRQPDGLVGLFSALASEHDERVGFVGALLRALLPKRGGREPPSDRFEEISRMNCELATMQRVLAQKCAAIERENQVLGSVAHDLRTPLSVIAGSAEVLLRGSAGATTPAQRHLLERIQSNGKFMATLIGDLLDFSAADSGLLQLDLTEFDLRDEIRASAERNAAVAERKSIGIEVACRTPLPIHGDRRRIRQVLDNLLGNAVKFSPPGAGVQVTGVPAGTRARVTVADHGPGIAADVLPTLFEPFQGRRHRGTAGEPSTGLGLAIVQRITDAHGGHIDVVSEPGRGASFSVELPMSA